MQPAALGTADDRDEGKVWYASIVEPEIKGSSCVPSIVQTCIVTRSRILQRTASLMPICATVPSKLYVGVLYVNLKLTIESHEPVQRLSASLLTPRQLTRLSCPCNVPTRSPRRTSQT